MTEPLAWLVYAVFLLGAWAIVRLVDRGPRS